MARVTREGITARDARPIHGKKSAMTCSENVKVRGCVGADVERSEWFRVEFLVAAIVAFKRVWVASRQFRTQALRSV